MLGAAQREFMIKNPNVDFQGINVEDSRSANVIENASVKYVVSNFFFDVSDNVLNDLQEYKKLMYYSELGNTDSSGTDSFWNIYKKYHADSIYVLDMSGTNHSIFTEIWPSKAKYEEDRARWNATYYIIREDMRNGISLETIVTTDYADTSYASLLEEGDSTLYEFLPCYNTPTGRKWFYHFIKVKLASSPDLVGSAPDVNYSGGLNGCTGHYLYVENSVTGDVSFTNASTQVTFEPGLLGLNYYLDISCGEKNINHYNIHNDICGTAFNLLNSGNSFTIDVSINSYVDLSAIYNN